MTDPSILMVRKEAFGLVWSRLEKGILDGACLFSGVGIWPRFVEPRWVEETHHRLPFPGWGGRALRILHLSDLHWGQDAPATAILKALKKTTVTTPDLVLWTGDFLVDGQTHDWQGLQQILCSIQGRFGSFACLGNHDYADYRSVDGGHVQRGAKGSRLLRILRRLLGGGAEPLEFPVVPPCPRLVDLLAQSGVVLLHNESHRLEIEGHFLEIGGVGDPWAGQTRRLSPTLPQGASILLAHNPDCLMGEFPRWSATLAGHTHGRQINLPFLGQRFCQAKGPFTRGLYHRIPPSAQQNPLSPDWVYVNRGLGCSLPFRVCSRPEIGWLELLPTLV